MNREEVIQKLIFALDVEHFDQAVHWVKMVKDYVGMFKVGNQLFTHSGPKVIDWLHRQGEKVFVDLKYHDIPHTVARAGEELTKLNVEMFNLHALGGSEMMKRAMEAVQRKTRELGIQRPKVIAVTLLTSLDQEDLRRLGFSSSLTDHVLSLARLAIDAGLDGVIASPHEIPFLRSVLGYDFMIVTPGIRIDRIPEYDDQKRAMTPREAIHSGADYIVLGRSIQNAKDPIQRIENMIEGILS